MGDIAQEPTAMLVFIVPIKSAKISRNWALVGQLFERCLRAICKQTSPNFRVVVVCNEKPDIQFSHPHVHYVEVDFPPPLPDPTDQNTTGYEYSRSKDMARKDADKARKILTGLEYAQRLNPTHSMVVDADDCVSCHLAEFVTRNPQGTGWFFKRGYLYPEGGRFLYLNRQNFNQVCGSSVIIAYHLRQALFPRPDYYMPCFEVPPVDMNPLPFVGAVYSMAHGDNMLMSAENKKSMYGSYLKGLFSRRIFATVRKISKYWPTILTDSIRTEFGLYKIQKDERGKDPVVNVQANGIMEQGS